MCKLARYLLYLFRETNVVVLGSEGIKLRYYRGREANVGFGKGFVLTGWNGPFRPPHFSI